MDERDEPSFEECQTDEEMDQFFAREDARTNRADPTRYPCPRCHHDVLSAAQKAKGYICDSCADKAESGRD